MNLAQKYQNLEKLLQDAESERRKQTEEIEILSKRLEMSDSQRDLGQEATDSLVSKLNARISTMKLKEQRLYEENAKIETMYNEMKG